MLKQALPMQKDFERWHKSLLSIWLLRVHFC